MSAASFRPACARACLLGLLAVAIAGCGKKGPPLAPLVSLPVAPTEVSARRLDDTVVVRFTTPVANVSGVRPADLARVEVYAWTGEALPPEQVFRHASLVASVPVRRPPPTTPEGDAPVPPPVAEPGLDQGAAGEIRERLGSEALVPLELPGRERPAAVETPLTLAPPDLGPVMEELPSRHYVVVGVNRRGRRGTPAGVVSVPLWPSPRPPGDPAAKASEKDVLVTWSAPEGVRASIHPPNLAPPRAAAAPARAAGRPAASAGAEEAAAAARALAEPPEADRADDEDPEARPGAAPAAGGAGSAKRLPSRLLFPWPDGSTAYHVYEVLPPDAEPPDVPPAPAGQPYPRLLTPKPIAATQFTDARLEFGVERCYEVRTVETVGRMSAESAASPRVCIEPADVFPPAAPRSLGAVASEGAISLIWERNTEPDLAGYIVLRAEAPNDPVEPITPEPIRETTYRDTNVRPGTRYVYAVVAVDRATPPNASPPSDRVEETAR